jgi:glycosyltransferase involved in cell wall biosynthesis
MCTWNSNKPWFRKCLLSIKREVNVHHFIVVDRYSSDGTLDVIRSVFPDAIIIQTNANLAVARKIGIGYVETKYFAFIDDDVELCKSWFTQLFSLIKRRTIIGAAQGFTRYFVDYLDKLAMFELRRRKGLIREISRRGYCHNTIFLTKLVKDFKPPPMVHALEDFLLTQHIIKKGYKWVEVNHVQIIHYMNSPSNVGDSFLQGLLKEFERAKWTGAGVRLVKAQTLAGLIFSLLRLICYGVQAMIVTLDPRTLLFSGVTAFGLLSGFLFFREHITPIKLRQIG